MPLTITWLHSQDSPDIEHLMDRGAVLRRLPTRFMLDFAIGPALSAAADTFSCFIDLGAHERGRATDPVLRVSHGSLRDVRLRIEQLAAASERET